LLLLLPLHPRAGAPAVPFLGAIRFSYWADPGTLLFTMMAAMGFAELRRLQVRQLRAAADCDTVGVILTGCQQQTTPSLKLRLSQCDISCLAINRYRYPGSMGQQYFLGLHPAYYCATCYNTCACTQPDRLSRAQLSDISQFTHSGCPILPLLSSSVLQDYRFPGSMGQQYFLVLQPAYYCATCYSTFAQTETST
jgi:hypothetical protein